MKLRAVLIALSLALAGGIPSLITAVGTVALSDRMIIRQEDLSSAASP